jgi:hypothetical protein
LILDTELCQRLFGTILTLSGSGVDKQCHNYEYVSRHRAKGKCMGNLGINGVVKKEKRFN